MFMPNERAGLLFMASSLLTLVRYTESTHSGDYRGRAPHVPLTLVHSETTGALSPESLKSIAHLDKLANKPAHRDGTQYGSRRGATRSFRRHHTSEISSAIVYADAETLLAHAEGAPV